MEMESITKFQAYQENSEKNNVKSLKSHLILSNQKFKYQNYITKKQYLHSDSYKKSNESEDMTGISRISSMTPSSSQLQVTNKKPKGRVSFAPKYRLINYIYYDPKEVILKEENNIIKEEEIKKDENIDIHKKNELTDKVAFQCTCSLM